VHLRYLWSRNGVRFSIARRNGDIISFLHEHGEKYSEPRVKKVVTILTADASDIEGQTPLLVIPLEEACAANLAAEIVPADHRPRYEAI
jgi:hypothetical protein